MNVPAYSQCHPGTLEGQVTKSVYYGTTILCPET
jgi:hypothetical protein